MDTRLLVSLSGVGNTTLLRLTNVIAELADRGVPVALLVRPQECARSPLVSEWVRARARQGDGVLLHGYNHAVTTSRRPMPLARKAEFATLPAHEAGLRLTAAVATLERIGLPIDGFAPPRWLASAGTLTALRRLGFALCADAVGVHDLRTGELHRARVRPCRTPSTSPSRRAPRRPPTGTSRWAAIWKRTALCARAYNGHLEANGRV